MLQAAVVAHRPAGVSRWVNANGKISPGWVLLRGRRHLLWWVSRGGRQARAWWTSCTRRPDTVLTASIGEADRNRGW